MSQLVVFEEEDPIKPLTLTRPAHLLYYGYRPIISYIRKMLGQPIAFVLPERFTAYCSEKEKNAEINPERLEGDILAVNGCLTPEDVVLEEVKNLGMNKALVKSGRLIAVKKSNYKNGSLSPKNLKEEGVELLEVNDIDGKSPLIKGAWELVDALKSGLEGRGVVYAGSVNVEEPVTFDTSRGPVLLADNVRLESFSRIEGPCLVGRGTVIHSARVNGHTLIGESCRVGGEVEWSIISSFTNKAHFGYVGHSYLGEWVNMGAGSVTSDLKNTYGTVRVELGGVRVDTGMVKLGAFVSDYAKVAINAMIFAGRGVGAGSHIYGLVDKDIPPFTSFGIHIGMGVRELSLSSVVETARRMKARRNQVLSQGEEELINSAYMQSEGERKRFVDYSAL